MSFYLDDDDDFFGSQGKSIKKDDDVFVCASCGGTESYLDATTGILTCTVCFTQSQNYVAPSQMEMDIEDAIGLAGRNRGGQLIETGNRTRKRKRSKKRLEEHDSAVRLPSSIQCIAGMQRILEESTRIVCKLAGQKESFQHVLTTIKDIWQAYLLSWKEGADHFGKLYPDVRYSFRDQFLDGFQRSAVSKTLLFQFAKRLKQHIIDEEGSYKSAILVDCMASSFKEDSNNVIVLPSAGDLEDSGSCSGKVSADGSPTLSKMETERSQIVQVICHHLKHKKGASYVGRKEAALMLQPSMTMVVAMLILATTPIGITKNQILIWIDKGSLPLLNGFSMLKDSDKGPLQPIMRFFNLPTCPSVHIVDRMVRNLHVACGFEQRKIVLNTKTNRRVETDASKSHKPGQIMIPAHVPVITASLVSDLGLGQQVLNYALSIMGKPILNEHHDVKIIPSDCGFEKFWLPPPLKKARLDLILDVNKILAVIIVALKLIPGWEMISFDPPNVANGNTNQDSSKFVVPNTAYDFQFLRTGCVFDNYLDFVEGALSSDDVVMPSLAESLDVQELQIQTSAGQESPSTLLTVSSATWRLPKKKCSHKYLLTPRPSTVGTLAWQMDPPLGPLLEYIANRTGTNPIEILEFVAELDEEVVSKCKKYNCKL